MTQYIWSWQNSQQFQYTINIPLQIKAIYDKLTVNITLSGWNVESFSSLPVARGCGKWGNCPSKGTTSSKKTNILWGSNVFVVVQLLSCFCLSASLWTTGCQASVSFTISQSLLIFMSVKLVTLSKHLMLCCPLLLLSSIFPNTRVFSNELALHIRWPKYWRFISPSNEYSGLISFRPGFL